MRWISGIENGGWWKNRADPLAEFRPGSFSAKAECMRCIKALRVASFGCNLSGTADYFRLKHLRRKFFIFRRNIMNESILNLKEQLDAALQTISSVTELEGLKVSKTLLTGLTLLMIMLRA